MTTFSTIVLVIVTAFYALQTKKTVEVMENTRKSQFLPALKVEPKRMFLSGEFGVEITNVGVGTAKNITGKVRLEPGGEEKDFVYPLLYPRDKFALLQHFYNLKDVDDMKNYNNLELSQLLRIY